MAALPATYRAMTMASGIRASVARGPGRTALIFGERRLSFGELVERIDKVASRAAGRAKVMAEQLAAFGGRAENSRARGVAHGVRARLIDALDGAGAAHFQIGRTYAGHPGVSGKAREAWVALKLKFDPDGIMNPGVLGLL